MIKHILTWLFKSIGTFLLGLPVTLLSPIVTLLALPFRVEHPETDTPFTIYSGTHRMVNLPRWAKWWDNIYDGMWGDKRGWWHNHTGDCTKFKSMWLWNGIRNPANWFSRHIKGIDVSDCKITKLAGSDIVVEDPGQRDWQFLMAERSDGKKFYRLFVVYSWTFKPEYGIMIDIGWKIKLAHNNVTKDSPPEDRYKGSVFTVSPWKDL